MWAAAAAAAVVAVYVLPQVSSRWRQGASAVLCGAQLDAGSVTWKVPWFCDVAGRVGSRFARPLEAFYTVGGWVCVCLAAVTLVGLTANLCLLLSSIFARGVEFIRPPAPVQVAGADVDLPADVTSSSGSGGALTLLVPGVTMPWAHVPHLMLAVFASLAWHECGHGLAAAARHLHVQQCGIGAVLCIPSAFVVVEDHLQRIAPARQLAVYAAGAWHNLLQAATALLLLPAVPHLLSPLYTRCPDCVWVGALDGSVLGTAAATGTEAAPALGVLSLNGLPTPTSHAFYHALAASPPRTEFCVPREYYDASADGEACCEDGYSGPLVCFADTHTRSSRGRCLPGREVAERYWRAPACCGGVPVPPGHQSLAKSTGAPSAVCLQYVSPVVADAGGGGAGHGREGFYSVNLTTGGTVVVITEAADLRALDVAEYRPSRPLGGRHESQGPVHRHRGAAHGDDSFPYSILGAAFPTAVEVVLVYTHMVCLGLVVANLTPCPGLDGEMLVYALLRIGYQRMMVPPAPQMTPDVEQGGGQGAADPQLVPPIDPPGAPAAPAPAMGWDESVEWLPGMYGDTGVLDHQSRLLSWQRWIVAAGAWLLGLNIALSGALTLF